MTDDEITLKEWIHERFSAQDKAVELLAVSHQRAIEMLAAANKAALEALAETSARETLLLKDQVERIATLHAEAHGREHALTGDALDKAATSMDKRLEGMNEFRAQLNQQAATFVRRDMLDAQMSAMNSSSEQDVRLLSERIDRETTSISARITALTKTIDDRLKILETASANMAGRLWALGVALGLLIIVANLFFK